MRARHLIWILLATAVGLVSSSTASLFSPHVETEEAVLQQLNALPNHGHSRKRAALYSDLGTLYYRKGEFQPSVEAFERSLEFTRVSSSQKRHIYRFLGKSYEGLGQLDKSIEAYEKAVVYDKKNWRRHRDCAIQYERALLYPKAVASYQKAIKFNSKETSLYVGLARIRRKMGLSQEADNSLQMAQGLGDASPAYYQELSFIRETQSLFEESAQAYQKVLNEKSSAADWGRLIYLAAMAGDKEMSNEGLNNLRKQEKSSGSVLFYEELVDLMQKKPREILTTTISDQTLKSLVQSVRPKVNP